MTIQRRANPAMAPSDHVERIREFLFHAGALQDPLSARVLEEVGAYTRADWDRLAGVSSADIVRGTRAIAEAAAAAGMTRP